MPSLIHTCSFPMFRVPHMYLWIIAIYFGSPIHMIAVTVLIMYVHGSTCCHLSLPYMYLYMWLLSLCWSYMYMDQLTAIYPYHICTYIELRAHFFHLIYMYICLYYAYYLLAYILMDMYVAIHVNEHLLPIVSFSYVGISVYILLTVYYHTYSWICI